MRPGTVNAGHGNPSPTWCRVYTEYHAGVWAGGLYLYLGALGLGYTLYTLYHGILGLGQTLPW